jgi:translation initiation factor aIF-2/yIF-2
MPPKAKAKAGVSAAAKAALERLELVKKLEQEQKTKEEEERLKREEEERKLREEEEREAEIARKKREAKLARKERLRAEGKLLSKSEKERRAKNEIAKQQMIAMGLIPANDDSESEVEEVEEAPKKKVVYDSKKTKQKKKLDSEENKPAEQAKADDGFDDWEAAFDTLVSAETEGTKGPTEQAPQLEMSAEDIALSKRILSMGERAGSPYRSPIVCILGHVDTGKTSLLDKVRKTSVQAGEAGGITQQIGATFFPHDALVESIAKVPRPLDIDVPGLLIIDTPGHESFNNLRQRGSSLCDIAILVVDLMHGLEPQTVESIEILRSRKCPFVVALNKVDRLFQWKPSNDRSIRDALNAQKDSVRSEFEDRWAKVNLQLSEKGINSALYWENKDVRQYVSVIPTSAHTGEGVPDLLFNLVKLSQSMLTQRITYQPELQCTVLDVRTVEGLGTTVDVMLINGVLREGDRVMVCTLAGPVVTHIRSLATPHPLRELRVKGDYLMHKQLRGSMGIKLCAHGLEEAVAGTNLVVLRENETDEEIARIKKDIMKDYNDVVKGFDVQPEGVYVMSSTLGSLEALMVFLKESKIPVSQVAIGEVRLIDVRKASIMLEKKHKEYAVILAFDVKVSQEAQEEADHLGIRIMTADIIYHLFDQFKVYIDGIRNAQRAAALSSNDAVFPCVVQIIPEFVFNKKGQLVFGVQIVDGSLRLGTPLCVADKSNLEIGRVISIEKDHKPVEKANRGDLVAIKIDTANSPNPTTTYGRHFDHTNKLYSLISRKTIDSLKEFFKEQMKKEDWLLVIELKRIFNII